MRSKKLRLVLLAFLMLFVELALIRWLGANIVYLSYFSNFVLLGSFLGIGIGFLRAKKKLNLFPYAPIALVVLVAFVEYNPVEIDRSVTELLYHQSPGATGLPIWLTLPIIFVAVAVVMTMIAEGVARTFKRFEPLDAYRLDITGSILGIIAFSGLSFLNAGPVAWGVVVAAIFVAVLAPRITVVQALAVLALIAILGLQTFTELEKWSPYYRIDVTQEALSRYRIRVNGSPHQIIQPISQLKLTAPIYFQPYERWRSDTDPEEVLIIGAGTGADVGAALTDERVKHIDAVEIDPTLVDISNDLHPDHPFLDERVDMHVTDGRAFLERTDKEYDLILYALPDSLTLVAGSGGVRLESFLFTEESIQLARDHLKPGGVFALDNFFRERFVADRIGNTIEQVFGQVPCFQTIGGSGRQALFMVSEDPNAIDCPSAWQPEGIAPEPASDDYPFIYLAERGIPGFYLATIGLILLISVLMIRITSGPLRRMNKYVDLFFMGAAFLLLETKNVVQFALLFGTTWFVNALVFAGILLTVLAAIEVAKRFEIKRPGVLWGLLFASLALAWAVPGSWLLSLSTGPRFVVAVLIAFTPVFLANLVFSRRFRDVGSSTIAFGTNLLGAMVGGVLEYGALVVGYRSLLIVAAVLYALAWLFMSRVQTRAAPAAAAAPVGAVAAGAAGEG